MQLELILAKELPSGDGFTWTVNSRLSDTLRIAEELFGERDKEYTILGVEFIEAEQPQVWFPGHGHILIQLSYQAMENVNLAIYQLAHETIHCLSPQGKAGANVLEEGLATYFSEHYMITKGLKPLLPSLPTYAHAMGLVKELLTIDFEIIRKVRLNASVISQLQPDHFLQINPNISIDLLNQICLPFAQIQSLFYEG